MFETPFFKFNNIGIPLSIIRDMQIMLFFPKNSRYIVKGSEPNRKCMTAFDRFRDYSYWQIAKN